MDNAPSTSEGLERFAKTANATETDGPFARYRPAPMRRHLRPFVLLGLIGLAGCATPTPPVLPPAPAVTGPVATGPFFIESGIASFYGSAHKGKTTAGGGRFDPGALTAAHRTLAFGTVVRVTNLGNGRMIKVKINDRGPAIKGRIIDLSSAAARALAMERSGVTQVRLEAFRADQSGAGS